MFIMSVKRHNGDKDVSNMFIMSVKRHNGDKDVSNMFIMSVKRHNGDKDVSNMFIMSVKRHNGDKDVSNMFIMSVKRHNGDKDVSNMFIMSVKRHNGDKDVSNMFIMSLWTSKGAKEEPATCEGLKLLGKAGWVKRATGRLFVSYKDRYIHVEKTEVAAYKDEELQNCLERIDLENYERCEELKSSFKKKHRLILIRSPRCGCKVHDVKFQAQSSEEKETWIKALTDGINRAKNKVFDEVKIDESCNLEHVTRTRPKGNQNRRPPNRIQMKQVASMSFDDVPHLNTALDDDTLMSNGTQGDGTPKEATQAEMGLPDVFLNDPVSDGLRLSPVICLFHGWRNKTEEERKSVDSGQHSDDNSEGTLGASTSALRGSHAVLDVLADEDDVQLCDEWRKSHVSSDDFSSLCSEQASKFRSASFGDLLSDSSCIQERTRTRAVATSHGASCDDITKVDAELPLEVEETGDLFQRVSQSQGGVNGEGTPDNLLAKAMGLKKADRVLGEVKKLEPAKNSSYRKSW
ncbi:uncharacterized protein plekho2 [Brachionichthys hirsutus]|uniref:uncharacterized protein plekho2 n=1 Tax=Brachionichthys hirsutus TaxID=412623 RepID=UPI003604B676